MTSTHNSYVAMARRPGRNTLHARLRALIPLYARAESVMVAAGGPGRPFEMWPRKYRREFTRLQARIERVKAAHPVPDGLFRGGA